jgi:quercetin dioxygenase-like cupin family protein
VLEVGEQRTPAVPGAVLFVAAGAEHRFVEIEEDLEVLVFFSKAAPGAPAGSGDER